MLETDYKQMMHDAVHVVYQYCHTLQRRGLALTSYIEGIIILVLLSCSSISLSYITSVKDASNLKLDPD